MSPPRTTEPINSFAASGDGISSASTAQSEAFDNIGETATDESAVFALTLRIVGVVVRGGLQIASQGDLGADLDQQQPRQELHGRRAVREQKRVRRDDRLHQAAETVIL